VGYNDEGAVIRWMAFDIETAVREAAIALLPAPDPEPEMGPEPEADKRLTDPVKIAADLEKRRAKAVADLERRREDAIHKREDTIGRLALDPNGNRIVAIGWQTEQDDTIEVRTADERVMLETFWAYAKNRKLVGFCSRRFDLPVIIQRSRMLGVPIPDWRNLIAPYGRSRGHVDLYDEWTLDGTIKGEIPNNLLTVCALNGIAIPDDDSKGKDMAALVAAGDYAAIRQHCSRDVERTVALARCLKVIPAAVEAGVF
jgi:predicted PolB exonuclease-like 3'-5' exonuclease